MSLVSMLRDRSGISGNPFKRAFDTVMHFPQKGDADTGAEGVSALLSLLSDIINADGVVREGELRKIESVLSQGKTPGEVSELMKEIKSGDLAPREEAIDALKDLDGKNSRELVSALLDVAWSDGDYSEGERSIVLDYCRAAGLEEDEIKSLEEKAALRRERMEKILRSGAGVLSAIIILALFVLTATFLKSVLFGLILAYFFLPLHEWYEKHLFNRPVLGRIFSFPSAAARVLFGKITGKKKDRLDKDEAQRKNVETISKRAGNATVITVVASAVLLGCMIVWGSMSYVSHVKSESKVAATAETGGVAEPDGKQDSWQDNVSRKTDAFVAKFEKVPGVTYLVRLLRENLGDPQTRDKLIKAAITKSGGVFAYFAGIIGAIASLLLNTLLTVFFFSLFINKLAMYRHVKEEKMSIGQVLVNSIFRSDWMPATSPETRESAQEILDTVFGKLQTWVRGYVSIIIIESIIYIAAFTILGVPYGPVLGLLAGFTILLPFIAPLASALLTLTVCLALGKTTAVTILGVIFMYVLMNGVLEQLFLYPRLVGEALGLNIFETIIVVLLGGLFAGISGMIFAVPTAAVLKYLFPRIYRIIAPEKERA